MTVPLLALSAGALLPRATAEVVTYPAPEGEPPSADYAVWVNGEPVFCYASFRFDLASQTTIAGRPVSPVSFCYFDHRGEVEVEVRLLAGLREAGLDTSRVVVRPLAHGLAPEVVGDRVRFRLSEPCQLTLEPGGALGRPLHIFANPLETDVPDPADPTVRYFGPGVHEAREIDLLTGQTVYIAGGAVVHLQPAPAERLGEPSSLYGLALRPAPGLFSSNWQKNVTLRGRGILCGRRGLEQLQRGHLVRVQGIEDLTIEGLILRESSVWSLNVVNCNRVRVSNVKIVGHYVNNDGLCIGGTSDALVEDCFGHNADDSFEVKV
ncbi:MAG: hypothetical protein FJX74_14315 [Armatimonadetes bacterium]|nr:hypothetical protein [Armatimonadota bacterium]